MGKLIFWVVVFIGGLVTTRILARKALQHAMDAHQRAQAQQQQPNEVLKSTEKMVRCEHCGLHLPRSEATMIENKMWCSKEHASLGAKQRA